MRRLTAMQGVFLVIFVLSNNAVAADLASPPALPVDPITGNNQSWKTVMEDTPAGGDNQPPGIFDVKSGAEGNSLEGTAYADW